ncbi:elastin-like [Rhipicephalus sanguineus]|uniref:elastin-like n=1 Tax=Rhipicephalus sanguineus TaxID=34632 RepID=UPI0018940CDF|nr:elastin-like [Rhipicephalus sanguineus]
MHCTTILAAAIFCTAVSSQEYAGSSQCGCLEVPATGTRHKDQFCRPHLTIPSERHRHRSCVCRPGLVRNAWGDCITKQECTSCKCFRDRDFNVCGRECPAVCNEPISRSCSKSCAFGCDCRPGFVRSSRHRGRCVKAEKCALSCPPFSRFEFCRSTCAPKCGRRPRKTCVTRCTRGDCVCNHGYAEVKHNGETICVPQDQCSQYLQLAPSITPGGNGSLGGGISSGGSVFVPGAPSIPAHPGGVSGGAAGTPVPGSVGINGSLGGGVSSGGPVFVPSTPSVSVTPGIVTGGVSGGTAGTSVPGPVGVGGASPIPSVPAVGTDSIVPVGGGSQPGSFGTGGMLPVPGANGGVSVGTYPQGGAAARPPGSTDAQGRPPIGTNGFGNAGGSIFTSSIGPNDSMESGEGSAVDARGIPQHLGESSTGGVPAATGTIPSNGNSGMGSVAGGLHSSTVPPKVTIPGRVGGMSTGVLVHGGTASPFPSRPGGNIESTHSSGSAVMGPNGMPAVTTPAPAQSTPGFGSVTGGGFVTGRNVTSSTVSAIPSGVSLPSGIPTPGVVIVTSGLPANGGIAQAYPGTNIASTLPSTVTGSTPPTVGIHGVGGPTIGSTASALTGGVLITSSPLSSTAAISAGGAPAVSPGSGNLGGGGNLVGLPAGSNSAITPTFPVAAAGSTLTHSGAVGVGNALHSGIAAGTAVTAPSTITGTVSSTVGPSSFPPTVGIAGASGSGSNLGAATTGHGVSVTSQPVTTGLGASSTVPAGTAAMNAAAIGGALVAGIPAITGSVAGARASGVAGINSAAHHSAPCGTPGSPCPNAVRSFTNSTG